jgi:hypothetical protein
MATRAAAASLAHSIGSDLSHLAFELFKRLRDRTELGSRHTDCRNHEDWTVLSPACKLEHEELTAAIATEGKVAGQIRWYFVLGGSNGRFLYGPNNEPARINTEIAFPSV